MGGRDHVFLAAQNFVFSVKRFNRSLSSVLTKMANTNRYKYGDPQQSEDYEQHVSTSSTERTNIEVNGTSKYPIFGGY
jgi:hypothetical protein